MKSSKYVIKKSSQLNILEAARRAGITSQRFRRVVKTLGIPVYKSGWTVLVDRTTITKVRKAIADGVIRRGRPPKKEARG